MKALLPRSIFGLWTALVASACVEVTYTEDGVPIVPFDAAAPVVSEYDAGGTTVTLSLESWTNRMPGPVPRRGAPEGFPVNVSLKLTTVKPGGRTDSLLVPALTLWSATGDSIISVLALVRTDGRDPWVHLGPGDMTTELTGDRRHPAFATAAPDLLCQPRLLIIDGGRNRLVSLPATPIAAVY